MGAALDHSAPCPPAPANLTEGGCTPASMTTRRNSTPSTFWPVTAPIIVRCRSRCARQTWPDCSPAVGGDPPCPVRARRDRPRPIPPRLHHGPRRHGVAARRSRLRCGPLHALDQEQEPEASGLSPRPRSILAATKKGPAEAGPRPGMSVYRARGYFMPMARDLGEQSILSFDGRRNILRLR
jgi:hypothetical protein